MITETLSKMFDGSIVALTGGANVFWHMRKGVHLDAIGFLPEFLSELDPRPAIEQFAENYAGGWDSFKGLTMDKQTFALNYEGATDMHPICYAQLRDESIFVYDCGWVAVLQSDGAFDVARLD